MTITITPDIWGPVGWKFIHFIALGYPQNPTEVQKSDYKTFFESIKNILPCSICSNNYKKHLIDLPLSDEVLQNREELLKWTIDMHNEVNIQNNKKKLSYDEAIDLMLNNFNDDNNDNNKTKINNIEYNKKSKIDFKDIDSEDSGSIFYSFIFWFVILAILVTIAIIYKKN